MRRTHPGKRIWPTASAASTSRSWTCSTAFAPPSRAATKVAGAMASVGSTSRTASGRPTSPRQIATGADVSASVSGDNSRATPAPVPLTNKGQRHTVVAPRTSLA